jgi:hypothetical protein
MTAKAWNRYHIILVDIEAAVPASNLMIRSSEESELEASGSDFTSQRGLRQSTSSRVVRE